MYTPLVPLKKGQFKEIPANVSRGYVQQWAYQGTAEAPYVVSLDQNNRWLCSCPSWTRSKDGVREQCKHILSIRLSTIPDVQASPAPATKIKPSASTGRKIR